MEDWGKYLDLIALPHSESRFSTILHNNFEANAFQNSLGFLIPQPTFDLGRTRVVHFTNGMPYVCLLAVQRKERHFFLIFVRIPFGIYVIEAQYIGML